VETFCIREVSWLYKAIVGKEADRAASQRSNPAPANRNRGAGQLATTIGDHLVDVHFDLSAAAGHPYVQREHVVMLAAKYLVTDLNDQLVALVIEPLARMVRVGGGFLQNGIRGNHLARNEVLADTEVLKGALDLASIVCQQEP
jgi:hypothetical protein